MSSARRKALSVRAGAVSLTALVGIACSFACGPRLPGNGEGGGTGGGGSTASVGDSTTEFGASVTGAAGSDSSSDVGTATSTSEGSADDTMDASSSGTGLPAVTAQDCFEIETQSECDASACSTWGLGPRVVIDESGECACEGQPGNGMPGSGYCLLFEGGIKGGGWSGPFVTEFAPGLVVDFIAGYTTYPIGWESCDDVADPPPACECLTAMGGCAQFDPPR